MIKRLILATLILLPMADVMNSQQADTALSTRAQALHKQIPLIDGHNDYPWALREKAERDLDKLDISKPQPSIMTDIGRLRAGGVGGQFWSVYVPADLQGQTAVTAPQTRRSPRHEAGGLGTGAAARQQPPGQYAVTGLLKNNRQLRYLP